MIFEEKAEIVISQLREDRDRLQNAIEQIKAEIDAESAKSFKYPNFERAKALEWVLQIIEKYTEESEIEE